MHLVITVLIKDKKIKDIVPIIEDKNNVDVYTTISFIDIIL